MIGNVYHSPNSTRDNTNKLNNLLKSEEFNSFDRIIITGDFNYSNIKWNGEWVGEKENEFIESLRDGFFTQHVQRPTRYRVGQQSNILDLVLTRDVEDILCIAYCSPLGKSDHLLLKILTSISKVKEPLDTSEKYDWNKGQYDNLRTWIKSKNWKDLTDLQASECWKQIKSSIDEGRDLFIPKSKITSNKRQAPRWMNFDVRKSIKKKNDLPELVHQRHIFFQKKFPIL